MKARLEALEARRKHYEKTNLNSDRSALNSTDSVDFNKIGVGYGQGIDFEDE